MHNDDIHYVNLYAGSLALAALHGNMADVEKETASDEQISPEENDVEEQMDVDQEPELDK